MVESVEDSKILYNEIYVERISVIKERLRQSDLSADLMSIDEAWNIIEKMHRSRLG